MRLSSFETYSLYLALKNHFSRESYDFFKYHGKTNASKDSFMTRRDRFQFQKISRLFSEDEMLDMFVANFLKDKTWIGDMMDEEARNNLMSYRRRRQSLAYSFSNDLDLLFTKEAPDKLFRSSNNTIAPILIYIMREDISIETAVILDRFIGFSKNFDSLFEKNRMKLQKYAPFVEFDKNKMKNILKEKIDEHGFSSQRQEEGSASGSQREKAA